MFGISRQSIYQQENRNLKRYRQLLIVKKLVEQQRMEMPRIGTRKLFHLLKDEFVKNGVKIGRDALFNYLRNENLLVKSKKNYTKTTNSKHWLRKHPNLYQNITINKPEECFVSDITYVKSKEGTHYLSLVTDACSRKIMGYHLSKDMSSENVVKALEMIKKTRVYSEQAIHHSDRGLQYCSAIYQKELRKQNIIPSMTDGYDCYQNALAERINGILKDEFLLYKCNTFKELNELVKEAIHIYNTKRPHLSLGYKTPNFVHQKTTEENLQWSNSIT